MERVFILDGLRSHIGKINGMFRDVLPEQLAAEVLRALMVRHPLPVDRVIAGNTVGTGGNITRLAALRAGLPVETPAGTVDVQCASGLAAVEQALRLIQSGACRCVIAGGFDSSSLAPARRFHSRDPRRRGDGTYSCAPFSPQECSDTAMLDGAERTAQKHRISREALDRWAMTSHRHAASAVQSVEPFTVPVGGSTKDECIKTHMSEQLLRRLQPVAGQVTTAGNSCTKNDGAAFVILCAEKYIRQHGLFPKAEIIESSLIGGDPMYSPECAELAAETLLRQVHMPFEEMEAIEYNEAFAVISALFERTHPKLTGRYNRLGGALAYGHPYGASGAVILLHLLASLRAGSYGLCSVASAGGQGASMLVKAV